MRDVWNFPLVQGKERLRDKSGKAAHPTQKPEAMLERIITASSNKGDIVLDPYMGSGTTAIVALKHGRKFVGIEKDKTYFDLCCERIQETIDLLEKEYDKQDQT